MKNSIKQWFGAAIVLLLILFIGACAKSFNNLAYSYEKTASSIKEGDSEADVVAKLDRIQKKYQKAYPARPTAKVKLDDGKAADVYYMRTAFYPDDQVTDDELTPYIFVDGKLDSVGWDALGGPKTTCDPKKVAEYQKKMMIRNQAVWSGTQPYIYGNDDSDVLQKTIKQQQEMVQTWHEQTQRNNAAWDQQQQMMRMMQSNTYHPSNTPTYYPTSVPTYNSTPTIYRSPSVFGK